MNKIFIDGGHGTTALHIKSLLEPAIKKGEISLVKIDDHKDLQQRLKAYQSADLAIMCLPDDVALKTIVHLKQNNITTRIIDTSSANRLTKNWVYGLPELSNLQKDFISKAQNVTNPGCFATGAIAILRPLINAGVIDKNIAPPIFGVAGYSAGGKKLIGRHHKGDSDFKNDNAFGLYALHQGHKHIPEIREYSGLNVNPIFMPTVIHQERGMIISIPFNKASLNTDIIGTHKILVDYYNKTDGHINVAALDSRLKRLNMSHFNPINSDPRKIIGDLTIYITGWDNGDDPQITIHSFLDNLGKGAASQALQNTKLMLGLS